MSKIAAIESILKICLSIYRIFLVENDKWYFLLFGDGILFILRQILVTYIML